MLGNGNSPESVSPFSSETRGREAVFGVLQDPTRRAVLRRLDPDERWIDLADLAEEVADDDPQVPFPRNPDRLAAALHHNHLPKLAECGLVVYDYRENRVAVADRESTELYLELFED